MTCMVAWARGQFLHFAPPVEEKDEGKKVSTCVGGTFGFLMSFVVFFHRHLPDISLSPLNYCDFYLSPWPSVNL